MTSKLNRFFLITTYLLAFLCLFTTQLTLAQCSALSKPTVKYTFGQGTSLYSPSTPEDFGFTTTYILETGATDIYTNDGEFSIVNIVPDRWNVWHKNIIDHTQDGDGYMMLVNADENKAGEFYRDTIEGLCNGIQYEFSVWAGNADKNAGNRIKPNIRFVILDAYNADTLAKYETGDLPVLANFRWDRHAVEFDATTDKVVLLLINNKLGGSGNDLVLDDIAFTPCLPVYDIVGDSVFCIGEDLLLSPLLLASSYATPEYLWQKRKPDMTWEDIIIADDLSQPSLTLADTGWYKLFVAELGTMVSQAQCRSFDSIYVDVIKPLYPGKIAATETICYNTAPTLFSSVQNATSATETISYQWESSNNLTTWSNASSTSNTFQETTLTADRHYRRKATTDCYTEYSDTITITVYDELTNNVIANQQVVCDEATPDLINTTTLITGGKGDYVYKWQSSINATTWVDIVDETTTSYQSPTVSEDTYIRLVATDSCGIRNSNDILLDYQLTPMPDSIIEIICEGSPLPDLSVLGTSIQWYDISLNPIAPPSFNNTTLGTQSYFVSETILGCESELSPIKLTVNPQPVISLTPQAECDGDSASFIPIISGGTPKLNFTWYTETGNLLSTDSILKVKSVNSTFFSLVVSDQLNCSDSSTVNLTTLSKPELTLSDTSTCGESTITIIPNITNASGSIDYDWTESSVSFASTSTIDFDKSETSTYTLMISDANACKDTADITISVFPKLTITLKDTSMCDYLSVPLTTNVPLSTYQWSPASVVNDATIRNPIANPSVTTKLFLNSTDANNCSYLDSVVVTVFPKPNLTITTPNAICIGDSVQLSPTSDKSVTTYQWFSNISSLSATSIQNVVAKPTATTTYDLKITDVDGCLDTAQVTVAINPLPIVDAGNDVSICAGFNTTLQATGSANSYQWTPNATLNNAFISNPIATPLITDTITDFIVTGTDANLCENSDTVKVQLLFQVDLTITEDTSICDYLVVPLNTTTALATYQWSPASIMSNATIRNPIATPIVTTKIYLDGTDLNSCPYRDSLVVTVFTKPKLTDPNPYTICLGDSIQLSPNSDKPVDTFEWITNTTSLSNSSIRNPIAKPSNSTTYELKIKDTEGCLDTIQAIVTVNPLPIIDAGPDTKICSGLSTTLNATGNSTTYSWTPSSTLSNSSIANPTANPTSTTIYKVTGTSVFNCKDTSSVIIKVLNSPVPTVSIKYDRDVCIGDEVTFSIASSEYLGDNPTYQWYKINPDNSEIIISTTNSAKDVNFEDGTSFYLEAVSNEICVATSDKNITSTPVTPNVYQYPDLTISGPKTVCIGEPAEFITTDNNNVSSTFTWLTDGNTVLKTSSDQNYVFTSLTQESQIKVSASNPNFNCVNTTSLLTVKPIEVFLDVFADDTVLFNGASTNIYFATNADSLNQYTSSTSTSPNLMVSTNKLTVSPLENTVYIGNAFIGECETTDSIKIRIIPQVSAPYFFSPNGDDLNDVWIVKDLDKWPLTRVVILNRWGMEVARLGNRINTWHGTNHSGHPLPEGVYYYVIEAGIKDLDENKIINFSGYVTVTK